LQQQRKIYSPKKEKQNKLKYIYGLSLQEFNLIYKQQKGRCKLCGRKIRKQSINSLRSKTAMVDHNHVTGKIRGLLCCRCNLAIGLFDDNSSLLKKAAKYVT
jgi:uncharacterized protein YtpQ (UPF0354 family)